MWLKLKIMKVLKVCDCFTQHLTNISLDAAQSGETSGGAAETDQTISVWTPSTQSVEVSQKFRGTFHNIQRS